MGGLGSGRRRTRLGLDECRALELGELCDQGRWRSQPSGKILWRSRHGGETLARLTYVISGQEDATEDLLLTYRYECEGAGPSVRHELELDCAPRRRACVTCPGVGLHSAPNDHLTERLFRSGSIRRADVVSQEAVVSFNRLR